MTKNDFKSGYRIIMLLHRSKEGGHNRPDYHSVIKRISRNEQEFDIIKEELLAIKQRYPEIPYRLYSSINPRNIEKAIRLFKFEQLEADYFDPDSRLRFYEDIRNRWVGCVASQKARESSLFLIDIDTNDGDTLYDTMKHFEGMTNKILLLYDTPNGHHLITEPYNPNLTPTLKIKKDALLFWE